MERLGWPVLAATERGMRGRWRGGSVWRLFAWLGQREERKGLVFECCKMAMRKRKGPGLVSKGGGGRPLWTGKWKWAAAWVREKKGAEGEMAGGLSSFCFSGFGRERESGSSLALSRSLLAKGRGRDRLVLVKIGLGSLSFPFFLIYTYFVCVENFYLYAKILLSSKTWSLNFILFL